MYEQGIEDQMKKTTSPYYEGIDNIIDKIKNKVKPTSTATIISDKIRSK